MERVIVKRIYPIAGYVDLMTVVSFEDETLGLYTEEKTGQITVEDNNGSIIGTFNSMQFFAYKEEVKDEQDN